MIKILQLGNGGAFNFKDTNSSFLLNLGTEDKNKFLLFDCGYSVYIKLQQLAEAGKIDLKQIKDIYISHLDDDHIGSLKTFIYYQYYVNQTIVNIYTNRKNKKKLFKYLKEVNKSYIENYTIVYRDIINVVDITKGIMLEDTEIFIRSKKVYHYKPCSGLLVRDKENSLFITGDTTAHKKIEKFLRKEKNKTDNKIVIFHDYSSWNEPSKQVHACEDNINNSYSKEFIKVLNKYHCNLEYSREWKDIKDFESF